MTEFPLPELGMQRASVYAEARECAAKHKWIESEKAGRDLGFAAWHGWYDQHWDRHVRRCWGDHLRGIRLYDEHDRGDFNFQTQFFSEHASLVRLMVDHIVAGRENLDIIQWALRESQPLDTVMRILLALNVNEHRLPPERGLAC